jgi:hypothetical protein
MPFPRAVDLAHWREERLARVLPVYPRALEDPAARRAADPAVDDLSSSALGTGVGRQRRMFLFVAIALAGNEAFLAHFRKFVLKTSGRIFYGF